MRIIRISWVGSFCKSLACPWIITCMMLSGCGGSGALQPQVGEFDELLMRSSYASDAEEGTPTFNEVFVEGATLVEDRTRYGKVRLRLQDDSAGTEPNTRILDIRVLNGETGEEVGMVQWTAVQVGEDWRIKDAPLP